MLKSVIFSAYLIFNWTKSLNQYSLDTDSTEVIKLSNSIWKKKSAHTCVNKFFNQINNFFVMMCYSVISVNILNFGLNFFPYFYLAFVD